MDLGSPPREPLRLPVWMVIALVIILFTSCSAASDASDAADSARRAASLAGDTGSGTTTLDEVQAMCQLLGAVAVKQEIDLDQVFEGTTTGTSCQAVAQQAAHP
ncbi:hypothetical protein GCM10027080_34440 [Pedococcus soli]